MVIFAAYIILSQPLLQRLQSIRHEVIGDIELSRQILDSIGAKGYSSQTLLVFANHAEQRTGGGFVGSVGVLHGKNGKLSLDSIRSIYFYDHRLEEKAAFKAAPPYFQNLSTSILARDSLLDGDSAVNARQFRDLFAREAGVYADNVVIITPKVLQLLLTYTGGIEIPEYGLTITADNVLTTLQQEIESGSDKISGKDPKTILGVLANRLMGKLPDLSADQVSRLYADMFQLMATRQAYIYSPDEILMKRLARWQQAPVAIGSPGSMQVTAANHIANKSSQAVVQKTSAFVRIGNDGTRRLQLSVVRHHTKEATAPYIDPRDGKPYQLIGDDLSWLQVALPAGSQLVDPASAFQQVATTPVTLFGRDILTKPLATTQVTAEFVIGKQQELGQSITGVETLLAQFGWFGQEYSLTIEGPEGYVAQPKETAEVLANGRQLRYTGFQVSDKQFPYEFKRQ